MSINDSPSKQPPPNLQGQIRPSSGGLDVVLSVSGMDGSLISRAAGRTAGAGLNSCSLPWGRSAIRGTAGLALHLSAIGSANWLSISICNQSKSVVVVTAALPRRIQYLRRSSAKTRSEPEWQSWLSMCWIRSWVTLWAGFSTTRWIVSEFSWSLWRSRPPTQMSWNTGSYSGARVIKRLDDGMDLPTARQWKSSGKPSFYNPQLLGCPVLQPPRGEDVQLPQLDL